MAVLVVYVRCRPVGRGAREGRSLEGQYSAYLLHVGCIAKWYSQVLSRLRQLAVAACRQLGRVGVVVRQVSGVFSLWSAAVLSVIICPMGPFNTAEGV
jgi:hypothetical protein